jgi:Xaa-Pro aminopeptidase
MSNSLARPPFMRVPFDPEHRRQWLDIPFAESEYQERWRRVGRSLDAAGVDVLVAFASPGDCAAVRWLGNMDSGAGHTAVLVSRSGVTILVTNALLHAEPMHSEVWMTPIDEVRVTVNRRHVPDAKLIETLIVEAAEDLAGARAVLGTTGNVPAPVSAALSMAHRVVSMEAVVQDLMAVKSPAEIALMEKANTVSDTVLEAVRAALRPGISEAELAGIAFGKMMEGGAEGPSFGMALVGGPRSGLKHVAPTDYRMQDGDFMFIDFGLLYHGYVTDNSRSGLVGKGTEEQRRFLETGLEMTTTAVAVAKPGAPQSALDDAAFEVARDAGYADIYWCRAHGVGTTTFMAPRFAPGDQTPLRVGEVFSLEPMLVHHGVGTACIENTVLITETGARVLSKASERWW